jgi:hypothetical protein
LFSNWDELNGHYRRYDRAAVKKLAAAAGGELVRLAYFFHALWLPAWLLLRLKGRRGERFNPPRGCLASALHRALAWGFRAEYRLLPRALPGTSLIFVYSSPPAEKIINEKMRP